MCFDLLRSGKYTLSRQSVELAEVHNMSQADNFEVRDEAQQVRHIIAHLPVQQQKIVTLRDVKGCSYEEIEQAQTGEYTSVTPISASHFMMPYWNPYNADGSLASENDGTWKGTGQNPIEWMANNPVEHKKYKLLSTVFADITPVKNLTVRAQFGADYAHSTSFMKSYPSYIINNNSGRAGRSSSDILNLTETLTDKLPMGIE